MGSYTQENRALKITTPLGPNALLPVAFQGREGISELFHYQLELLADKDTPVSFEKLIGQKVHVELALSGEGVRHFHGIVTELTEGAADEAFLYYRMTIAPALWRLTRRQGFRIFQDQSVPDILKEVLADLDVRYQLVGPYRPRNFCVQYAETDFAFASRLMEEEGILYYFEQDAGGNTLVITDQPGIQPDIAGPSTVRFDRSVQSKRLEPRVTSWQKTQQLCSGRFTFWDYNFQMPDRNLEASYPIQDQVAVGSDAHRLDIGGNKDLEIFQFTGGYGGRYDAVDVIGSENEEQLQHLFEDNRKFARLRMEREASQSLRVEGKSTCSQFVPGRHFTLANLPHADGAYLLTRVTHRVQQTGYRSGEKIAASYDNDFVAVPKALPYRSPRVTPRPNAHTLQPAVVVGPKGEEIFTDRFGRVKIQFAWDRHGKHDARSSCWVRVAQAHAGKGFGFVSLPRVGEEVLVGFAGDNPDRPVIVGRLYNARNMPPFELPRDRSRSGLKTHSIGGNAQQFSGLAVDDQLGQEHLGLHSERHMTQSAEGTMLQWVGGDHQSVVGGSSTRVMGLPSALQRSPAQPQGSGAGGGAPPTGLADTQAVLRDAQIQFGWATDGVIGTQSELVFGQHIETTINPIGGMESLIGANLVKGEGPAQSVLKGAITFGSAHTEVTIGNHCEILHGLGMDFKRGQELELHTTRNSGWAHLAAGLYTLIAATVDIVMPVLDLLIVDTPVTAGEPSTSSTWAQVGEKEALNLSARILMDTMLAVWMGIEMKIEAVEQQKEVLAKADADGKIVADTENENSAEALAAKALEEQRKLQQETVDKLWTKAITQAQQIQKLQQAVVGLGNASTKTYDGLFSLTANSVAIAVKPGAEQETTTLALQALRPVDRPEVRSSVQIFGADYASMITYGGAGVHVGCAGAAAMTQIGNASICSGREGKLAMKMGHFDEPHAMLLHKDGVKIFSGAGGIHILHGASAKFAEIEAAEAPRKIVIESRDAPVEIHADRVLIRAGASLRLECGANFLELNQSGMIQNVITESAAADAAFLKLAAIQTDEP